MKKIKTYNNFINEGIRDKMTPKSKEDVKKSLDKLEPNRKLELIFSNKITDYYTKDEIKKLLDKLEDKEKISMILTYKPDVYSKKEIEDVIDKCNDRKQHYAGKNDGKDSAQDVQYPAHT